MFPQSSASMSAPPRPLSSHLKAPSSRQTSQQAEAQRPTEASTLCSLPPSPSPPQAPISTPVSQSISARKHIILIAYSSALVLGYIRRAAPHGLEIQRLRKPLRTEHGAAEPRPHKAGFHDLCDCQQRVCRRRGVRSSDDGWLFRAWLHS
ncbi:hypothetical protein XA68_11304 [Ophiocordyceps unilateralis]|uniref:Uncharacterized protein n=1 Tax=Ophiocordyceps unilateralis TaxID=268505 RepID=A0A2A9PFU6_OPHUN|nr:hypothetical protein XA68_11304 [Ophiocordyceps unilateralis]